MRYISPIDDLPLLSYGGYYKYKFKNGVLVIGDPTLNSDAADKIDENQSSPVKSTELMILYPELSGLARFGLGQLFFEAPPLESGDDLTPGDYYEVIAGRVTYNGATYKLHEKFYAVTGVVEFNDANGEGEGALLALAIPPEYAAKCNCHQNRTEWFKIRHLEHGKEPKTYFDLDNEAGYTSWNYGSTLETLNAPSAS